MYKCPECGCERFNVEQTLWRYVEINGNCEIIGFEEDYNSELSLNDWMCMECGYQGHNYEFEVE